MLSAAQGLDAAVIAQALRELRRTREPPAGTAQETPSGWEAGWALPVEAAAAGGWEASPAGEDADEAAVEAVGREVLVIHGFTRVGWAAGGGAQTAHRLGDGAARLWAPRAGAVVCALCRQAASHSSL